MRRRVGAAGTAATLMVCGLLFGAASPAEAYVRYRSDAGASFAWPQTCVLLTGYQADFTDMTSEEVTGAMQAAANTWSGVSDPCTYLSIMLQIGTVAPTRVRPEDRRNQVLFRTLNWCLLKTDGSCDPLDHNYPQEALALTTVSAVVSTGVLRDVDVEINALNHNWADLVAHPELAAVAQTMNIHDLQNALTHEFGHLIGLDHTCHPNNMEPPHPLDQNGFMIPACNGAPADVQETTMFNSARSGDIHMRTLAPDDQQAVCDIYPAASDPMTCNPTPPNDGDDAGCNCATGGTRSPRHSALVLIVVGLVCGLLLFSRRRGSRASCGG